MNKKERKRKFADVAYKLASQFGDIEGPISERRPRAKMMTTVHGQLFKSYNYTCPVLVSRFRHLMTTSPFTLEPVHLLPFSLLFSSLLVSSLLSSPLL
jgi:hypothetical protein